MGTDGRRVLGRDAALWQDGGRLDYREAWAARDDAADCTNAGSEEEKSNTRVTHGEPCARV